MVLAEHDRHHETTVYKTPTDGKEKDRLNFQGEGGGGMEHAVASFQGGTWTKQRSKRRIETKRRWDRFRIYAQGEQEKRLAVFVSGGGSNFRAIHEACVDGRIRGKVVAVVSNKPGCGGWNYALEMGIPTWCHPTLTSEPRSVNEEELTTMLKENMLVDYVLLAGYLKKIPVELVHAYRRAMLNIHPALLPSFGGPGYYGIKVHKAVVNAGCRVSGPTVHFVDEEYDSGKIVGQRTVQVYPTDTPEEVAARVLKEEHVLYPHVVAALCDGRVAWNERGIPMICSETEINKWQ